MTATCRWASRSPSRANAGAWALRIYIKPFVDWIWGGCFLMALGGFIAMADRRYRLAVAKLAGRGRRLGIAVTRGAMRRTC